MTGYDFFNLSLSVQAALGAGYLGYVTAYAGFRKEHRVEDALFISLAFAACAMLTYGAAEPIAGTLGAFLAAFASSILIAACWRRWGRKAWLWCVSEAGIHRDDGSHHAWSQIVQTDRRVGQISVHLKDGRTLYLNNRELYGDAPWRGLYLGGDGAIVMVVEEEEMPDGTEEIRSGISDDVWGTRLTYIPPDEVRRVNIRMK